MTDQYAGPEPDGSWLTSDVADQVAWSANKVARRYRGYVEAADLRQEGLIYVYTHQKKMHEWMTTEHPKIGWRRFIANIEGRMHKVARQEKAAASGYRPEDEEFYGLAQLELLLPALWDESYRTDGPPREGRERTAQTIDPSEGGTWRAMVLDVERAWGEADLTTLERSMLRYRYGGDKPTYADLGRAFDVSSTTAERYVKRALRSLQEALGGPKPQDCSTGCECAGHRKAQSNDTARWIVAHNYEE